MTEVSYVRPVTMIHEELTPSPEVQKALNQFLDREMKGLKLYTTARRIIDLVDSRRSQYDPQIRLADSQLKEVARKPLSLSGRTVLREHPDGRARLFIEPANQVQLDEMVETMTSIPSLEMQETARNLLYVDFSKECLTKDVLRRRDAADDFHARAHHPVYRHRFIATGAHITQRDIIRFPVRPSETA